MDAIATRPWLGWGWNLVVLAHSELATAHEPIYVIVGHTHNLFLDLMVWAGIPIGGALGVACIYWMISRSRTSRSTDSTGSTWALLAVPLILFSHAMLELPHVYAQFLLPAALLVGVIDARLGAHSLAIRWPAVFQLWVAGLIVALGVLIVEYRQVSADLLAHRVWAARIAGAEKNQPHDVLLLAALQRALVVLRNDPAPGMSPTQIDALDHVAKRYPSTSAQFKSAQAFALNGQPAAAATVWRRLCLMHTRENCAAAAAAWREVSKVQYPQMQLVRVPPATEFGPD
jgi:hypothetical protein